MQGKGEDDDWRTHGLDDGALDRVDLSIGLGGIGGHDERSVLGRVGEMGAQALGVWVNEGTDSAETR